MMARTSPPRATPTVVVWASDPADVTLPHGLGAAEVVVAGADTIEREIADADVVLAADFSVQDPERVWRRATRARWIHIRGTGVDHLLTPALVGHPAVLTNGRGCFDRTIAEFVLMQLLALAKGLPGQLRAQAERSWRPRCGGRLDEARVLVIGPGAIGSAIAGLVSAIGVQVDGAGRNPRPPRSGFGRIRPTGDLASYVGDYDYVVVAAPLTNETRHLVDAAVLGSMKPSARLINVARGAVVDEQALVAALRAGTIGGAALDVFETEPLPRESELWRMPNVIVTPHMAGDFAGWLDWQYRLFAENYARFVAGQPLRNVVDKKLGYVIDPGHVESEEYRS